MTGSTRDHQGLNGHDHPWRRSVLVACVCVAGALFIVDAFPGTTPAGPFPWFPGNDIDAAMNLWLLERNLTLLREGHALGQLDRLFTTGTFWPDSNTLAWSDNWLMATPVYGALRLALSASQAFAALIAVSLATNTLACYRLTRHGSSQPLPRLAAAGLASLSLTVVARIGHAQLMPAFAGILAMDALLGADLASRAPRRWRECLGALVVPVAWLQLQVAIGFYLGVFFALACTGTFGVLVMRRWLQETHASMSPVAASLAPPMPRWPWYAANVALVAVNGVIYRQYAQAAAELGPRSWNEVSTMVPRAWSYGYHAFATVERVSLPAPVQFARDLPGPVWEHSLFPGYAFAAALLAAALCWTRLRRREALVGLTYGCGCLLLLTLGIGSLTEVWSLWRVLYELVPGMSAIRSVARVGLVLSWLAAPVLAAGLEHWMTDRRGRVSVARWVALGALWAVSTLSVPDDHRVNTTDYERRRQETAQRLATVVHDRGCVAFYVPTHPDTPAVDAWRWQVMAMWGALAAQTPTVNGYSGHEPQGGWSTSMTPDALDHYLDARGVPPDTRARVCHIPPDGMLPR